jgi:DNA-binding IclR family transcriptional regulator
MLLISKNSVKGFIALAPIRDRTNKVIAALSISAPAVRLTMQKIEKLKIH